MGQTPTYLLPYPELSEPADVPLDMKELADRLELVIGAGAVPLVSALPGSPADGQRVLFQNAAMAALGVAWQLRYRAAAAGAYKWEFVGGASLTSEVPTAEGIVSGAATFMDCATVGPDFTVPLAGDYEYQAGATIVCSAGTATGAFGLAIGAAAQPASADQSLCLASTINETVPLMGRLAAQAAGTLLRLRYFRQSGVTMTFSTRKLAMRPIRVG